MLPIHIRIAMLKINPKKSSFRLPLLAPATPKTLSVLMMKSAIRMVKIASRMLAATFIPS